MRFLHKSQSHPNSLTVVYDGDCMLCRRSVRWLRQQRTYVEIALVAASDPGAIARFGHTVDYGQHMITAAEDGRVWIGVPDAYLVVMWAVGGLRLLSYVLSIRQLKPLAGRVFRIVTGNRHVIGRVVGEGCVHCVPIG